MDASVARFSVARYQRMIETGILTADDKVELLENHVIHKIPRTPRHDSTIQRMLRPLMRSLPAALPLVGTLYSRWSQRGPPDISAP